MRYRDPQLRDRLAAEYVLGTLRGGARARFRSLLKYDAELRRLVADWEERLTPMAAAAGEVQPPARVWRKITARIGAASARGGWVASLAFWRGVSVASATLALALAAYLGATPRPEPPMAMVAVMSDEQARPAMVVSWPPQKTMRNPYVRIHIVQDHPTMASGTSWELWMLPDATGSAKPVSLGLIGIEPRQILQLDSVRAKMMGQAWGVALSIEPAGGSPTGAPTGPVIFKGQCVRMM